MFGWSHAQVYNGMGVAYFVLANVVGFFLSAGSYLIYEKWFLSDYGFSPGFDKTIVEGKRIMKNVLTKFRR